MPRPPERTHYDTLGVARTADTAEIRRVYRQLVRRHHPDLTTGRPESDRRRAEARIRELNQAWSVLGHADARRDYDRELQRREPQKGPLVGEDTRSRPAPAGAGSEPATYPRVPGSDTARTGRDSDLTDLAPGLSPAFVRVLLWGPVVLIVVIGVALFVFTAYAGREDEPQELASCVLRGEGREAVRVDCDEPNDGTVVTEAVDSSQCPQGTTPLIVTEPAFDGWVCTDLSPTDAEASATD